jgi:hypothetical protein
MRLTLNTDNFMRRNEVSKKCLAATLLYSDEYAGEDRVHMAKLPFQIECAL